MQKVYLITGASSEVGMAYIKKLDKVSEENITVVAHYGKNGEGLEQLQKELSHIKLCLLQADLSTPDGAEHICARAVINEVGAGFMFKGVGKPLFYPVFAVGSRL